MADKQEKQDTPMALAHGALELPRVRIDGYNLELGDAEGFIGGRASKRAFQEILEDWRQRLRRLGGRRREHERLAPQGSPVSGRLVCVLGASGAGKDALIAYARAHGDPARLIAAHRYITRPADAGGENHVALSPAEFAAREAAGLFALSWESHGLHYGIGAEIDLWLARGFIVLINLAREAWEAARRRYPDLAGVLVSAPPEIRARRLAARGREDAAAIAERLAREVALPEDPAIHRLDNSGDLAVAGERLTRLLAGIDKEA